jgi:hypothetical protein
MPVWRTCWQEGRSARNLLSELLRGVKVPSATAFPLLSCAHRRLFQIRTAPRVGWKPYGPVPVNRYVFSPDDPFGWQVHEFDEALELPPDLHQVAGAIRRREIQSDLV